MNTTPQNTSLASLIGGASKNLQFGKIFAQPVGIGQHLVAAAGIGRIPSIGQHFKDIAGPGLAAAQLGKTIGAGSCLDNLNRITRTFQPKINTNLSTLCRRSVEGRLK